MSPHTAPDTTKRTRVLFAIPGLDRAGPDRVFYDLLRSFDRERFEPILAISSANGYYLERLPDDVLVRRISDDKGLLGRYPVLGLTRAVRELRPHTVVATLRMAMTAGLARPLFPKGTKLILRVANQITDNVAELKRAAPIKHSVSHWVLRRALRRADHIVCQSRDMEKDVSAQLAGQVPTSVIGNPVDLNHIGKLAAETPAQLRGTPSILCVARLMPQKGIDVLLEAFALLRDQYGDAHLTLVGEGPAQGELLSRARHLGIGNSVSFAGFVENPYPLMAAADLFALASRYEGFPNAVVEALACGTPVVASDCPGAARDILFEEEGGFLAPAGNASAFAGAMTRALAAGPFDRKAVAEACGRHHALKTITAAYESLCKGPES